MFKKRRDREAKLAICTKEPMFQTDRLLSSPAPISQIHECPFVRPELWRASVYDRVPRVNRSLGKIDNGEATVKDRAASVMVSGSAWPLGFSVSVTLC